METENTSGVLDLSKKGLKKIPKTEDCQQIRQLVLDNNDLQKIENIDSYLRIEKLSLKHNQLLRMYGVSRLHNLRELNLGYNGILTIEALKECIHLTHLNLEGNSIKTIEHLNTNLKLEFLNLGENSIGIISDISFLKQLKELYLHSNRITHLHMCDRYLPTSLEILTLGKNNIADLNEICTLSNLNNLTSITIADNPCVLMTGGSSIGFDYRPFLLNWCMSVKIIDGYIVSPIESLKAEWLYSQGKGRSFRVGEQTMLAQYLSQTCPLSAETLESENERKLRLILSKAQQHQRQLQEQNVSGGESPATTPNNTSSNNSPSSNRRKGPSRIQSPRISRLSGHRPATADAIMSSSFHGVSTSSQMDSNNHSTQLLEMTKSLIENFTVTSTDNLMTQSLDLASLNNSVSSSTHNSNNLYNEQSSIPIVQSSLCGPLVTASKMMPVPESLMSPDCGPPAIINQQQRPTSALTASVKGSKMSQRPFSSPASTSKISKSLKKSSSPSNSPRKAIVNTSNARLHQNQSILKQTQTVSSIATTEDEEEEDEVDRSKISFKSSPKTQKFAEEVKKSADVEKSAILIQKLWRGFNTRRKTVRDVAESLQQKRTQDYIMKLTKDMETTKQALENERKIQQLQMQAINALWKKVSNMQTAPESAENGSSVPNGLNVVQDLTKTCTNLTNQVQQLQISMREILDCMTVFAQFPQLHQFKPLQGSSETQTEIVAVHTPGDQQKEFPFVHKIQRPSSLGLISSSESSKTNTKTSADDLEVIKEQNGTSSEAGTQIKDGN